MDFQDKLKSVIIEVASRTIDSTKINDSTILTRDLGFDSVQIINLIVELELQFEIEIEDDDLDIEKLTVYKDLYEMIKNKLCGKELC